MMHSGHGGAALSIFALLASAWFLVRVGEKTGNCCQKVAKSVGWIALILSGLIVVGSIATCVMTNLGCGSGGKGYPMGSSMMGQEPEAGMGMKFGPGMGMHRGMGRRMGQGPGQMGMPPPPGEGPMGDESPQEKAPAERPQ